MFDRFRHSKLDQKCQHQTVTCQLADMSTDNGVLVTTAIFVRAMDSTKRSKRAVQLGFLPRGMKQLQDVFFPRIYPKDHWTLKTGYFEDPGPLRHTGSFTLPLEGPRSLG